MFTISDFIYLCTEPQYLDIEIWDSYSRKTVFADYASELTDEFADFVVESWEAPNNEGVIVINAHE